MKIFVGDRFNQFPTFVIFRAQNFTNIIDRFKIILVKDLTSKKLFLRLRRNPKSKLHEFSYFLDHKGRKYV